MSNRPTAKDRDALIKEKHILKARIAVLEQMANNRLTELRETTEALTRAEDEAWAAKEYIKCLMS